MDKLLLLIGTVILGLTAIVIWGLLIHRFVHKKSKKHNGSVIRVEIPVLDTLLSIAEEKIGLPLTDKDAKKIEKALKKARNDHALEDSAPPHPFIMRQEKQIAINNLMEYLHFLHEFYIKKPEGLHEFVKLHDSIVKAHPSVDEIHPFSDEFKIVMRICSIAYHKGKCKYRLNENTLIEALQWEYGGWKDEEVLKTTIENYEQYWDSVLDAYVRPSARIKRLHYLVEKLDGFSQEPCILQLSGQQPLIRRLQQKYLTILQNE